MTQLVDTAYWNGCQWRRRILRRRRAWIDRLTPVNHPPGAYTTRGGWAFRIDGARGRRARAQTRARSHQVEGHVDRLGRVVAAVLESRIATVQRSHPVVEPVVDAGRVGVTHQKLTHVGVVFALVARRRCVPSEEVSVGDLPGGRLVAGAVGVLGDAMADLRLDTDPVGSIGNREERAVGSDLGARTAIVHHAAAA